jgi:hypothetical protein
VKRSNILDWEEKGNVVKIIEGRIRSILALSFGCYWLASLVPAIAADANTSIPPIIQAGFALWPKGGAPMALDAWQKGGLIEGDRKVVAEANYFKRVNPAIGGFKSYELVAVQKIAQSSQIIYLSINFERAVVYARFLLYRPDQDWVVQNMDFSAKPEALIPWAALPAGSSADSAE